MRCVGQYRRQRQAWSRTNWYWLQGRLATGSAAYSGQNIANCALCLSVRMSAGFVDRG